MIACPFCGIKGDVNDPRQFEWLGQPAGGDPLYGCRSCKTKLMLVPGVLKARFHIVLADGWEIMSLALPENQPESGMPRMLTEEGRRSLRDLPMSARKRADALGSPDD